jgi:2C-methyl-D-erythritol 2,4-cyclodiphosphate synthase
MKNLNLPGNILKVKEQRLQEYHPLEEEMDCCIVIQIFKLTSYMNNLKTHLQQMILLPCQIKVKVPTPPHQK